MDGHGTSLMERYEGSPHVRVKFPWRETPRNLFSNQSIKTLGTTSLRFWRRFLIDWRVCFCDTNCLQRDEYDLLGWKKHMNQEIKDHITADTPYKAFALLASVTQDPALTVRDDLYDFSLLLDAVKLHQKQRNNFRFRLVDSGALSLRELEWLASEGADVYTNDEVGRTQQELESIQYASKKGRALLAYLFKGTLESDEDASIGLSAVKDLAACGVHIYISDKNQDRNLSEMILLADLCHLGQGRLVYYHHQDVDLGLFELGRAGAWIHISDKSVNTAEEVSLLTDVIQAARTAGANVCLHVEVGTESLFLEDLQKAGALLVFKSALIDYRSPIKPLEEKARRQKLDPRAYYLYPIFL